MTAPTSPRLLFATLAAASLATGGMAPDATPPRAAPLITWTPQQPAEGSLFVVRVTPLPSGPVSRLRGSVGSEGFHFARLPNGDFESLAAVPIGTRGNIAMTVTVTYADDTEETLERSAAVEPGTYHHERLTVAPEFGSPPDSAAQARQARDRAKTLQVARVANRTPRLWGEMVVIPRPGARVTGGFGDGREFNGQITSRHMGLDLNGQRGDTVVAAARGVVVLVDQLMLAGNVVYLNHGGGLNSGYFHLSQQLVSEGDTVEAGTPIGRVGATGRVTGPHLHWSVRYGVTSVDPRSWPGLASTAANAGG